MTKSLMAVSGLLAGTAILLVGHGLQLTLLPVRAEALGWTIEAIGITGSAYFGGFVAGCYVVPRFVERVGHVRTFMVLTATATAALLGIALSASLVPWLGLRFATGVSMAGLYLVIESWLNEQSPDHQRGAVLAVYTTVVLLAMVLGQLLLTLGSPDGAELIVVATLFLCLAAVPVGLTSDPVPRIPERMAFSLRRVLATSRTAVGGAFMAGLVTGAFYTVGPVLGARMGLDSGAIAIMMGAGLLGGAVLQVPLGRLSDRIDRRHVVLTTMAVGSGVCLVAATLADPGAWLVMFMFLLGGAVMPVYALCLAHANDKAAGRFLEMGTGILVVNAAGAVVGPTVASAAMGAVGATGFFWYCAVCLAVGTVYVMLAIRRDPTPRPHLEPFHAATKTTQGAFAMDPRSDTAEASAQPGASDPEA